MLCPARFASQGLFLLLAFWSPWAFAQAGVPVLRISTENSEDHVQSIAVAGFIDQLKRRAGDSLDVEFYPSARLFRDRDVVRALEQGRVEMALPGVWQLDRFVPDAGMSFLPLAYGLDEARIDKLRDGKIGAAINKRIEEGLGVRVLGRWIDLGPAHLFTMRARVRKIEDVSGLTIRTPGGEASGLRLIAQGAKPVPVSWPDLPNALKGRYLDGLVTTPETAASAKLWELGVRYLYEDRAYFAQYVPLVSGPFWNRLPPALQTAIQDAWEANVATARQAARQAQIQARAVLKANGMTITTPSPEELDRTRRMLMQRQPNMVKALGIDPSLVKQAELLLEGPP
ncbi:TRAP dicarboxylate transporter-DctP subunit [Rhodospirillaceae bacterium LM-1]|nr:TRAP dicarboxylate transporter-DctP subunit [Rhodospirillaceae bacterium LM-1]